MNVSVSAPLFISSRLMAALAVEGDTGGIINLEHTGTNGEGRQTYRWLIETHDHVELGQGDDLSSGVGDEPNFTSMMATLLSFLGAGAESYRYTMDGHTSDNADLFPPAVMEWAYINDDALGVLHEVLDAEWTTCFYCGDRIRDIGGSTWVDDTGGDCCSGDDDLRNENQPHSPIENQPHSPIKQESYALVVLMDGLVTESESVGTDLVVIDFDAYDNDPEAATVSPEEAVDKVRALPRLGTMGQARYRVLASLQDYISADAPNCFSCKLPTGSTGHIVNTDAKTWCCDDCWDERLR